MPKQDPDEMMVCTQSGSAVIDGVEVRFWADQTRVTRDSELVKRFPEWFKPLGYSAPVETATAAPGEKRATRAKK